MGKNEEMNEVPQSILEEILDETFQKLEDNEDFDTELILELLTLAAERSVLNEQKLISILRG